MAEDVDVAPIPDVVVEKIKERWVQPGDVVVGALIKQLSKSRDFLTDIDKNNPDHLGPKRTVLDIHGYAYMNLKVG